MPTADHTEAAERVPAVPLAERRSDAAIERISRGQHHVVTLAQLEALGLSQRAVRHRAAAGRLHRLHRGVYAHGRPTAEGRWMGAVLACGRGAVLSHRSAAALWGVRQEAANRIDVTVAGTWRPAAGGARVHTTSSLGADETTVRDGIPCTSLARTLVDLAGVVDSRAMERAIDRAEELREFDLPTIEKALADNAGRRGVRRLSAVLATYAGPTATRSEAEERLLELVERARLPRPAVNQWIPLEDSTGYRPDFLWRDRRLIVEIDGRTHHARRAAFRHDRRRDRRLALAGYETRRYDAGELFDDADAARVIGELRAFLARP